MDLSKLNKNKEQREMEEEAKRIAEEAKKLLKGMADKQLYEIKAILDVSLNILTNISAEHTSQLYLNHIWKEEE